MPGQRVLVLGGTGPAGICLLRELIHRSHSVVVYARNPQKIPEDISSSPLAETIKGSLDDTEALSTAVAQSHVVVSLLGPRAGDNLKSSELYSNFYKNSLFPAMRQHGVRRVYAMGTVSIVCEEDSRSVLRYCMRTAIHLFAGTAYRAIINIGEAFEKDAKDLDWSVFRIGMISGECDRKAWMEDREEGTVFVGWVAQAGWTTSQKRAALTRWLVDIAEEGLPGWVGKMPAVSRLASS
ncbi:NAD(P)-binding protein [Sarocladium strictum]